jgi:hypothetical protein
VAPRPLTIELTDQFQQPELGAVHVGTERNDLGDEGIHIHDTV